MSDAVERLAVFEASFDNFSFLGGAGVDWRALFRKQLRQVHRNG